MNRIKHYIESPRSFVLSILRQKPCRLIPDKFYISLKYWSILGRWPDIDNPQYLSEKIQWLKLNYHNGLLPMLVDKYKVREYIKEEIGEKYLIPIYGVWDKVEDIDWNRLPKKFVLKCTHGSHTNIICTDKSKLNIQRACKQLNAWLKDNEAYYYGREWPYKEVVPRIICEQYIESNSPGGIVDYKFMCFHGRIDNVMLCNNRQTGNVSFNHFDENWNFLRYQYVDEDKPEDYTAEKPAGMPEMWKIARDLSQKFPFVRVDLYYENNQVYFGELTFFPQSGFDTDYKKETDLYLGKKLDLSRL